jgi:choline-glycine betaine transporter
MLLIVFNLNRTIPFMKYPFLLLALCISVSAYSDAKPDLAAKEKECRELREKISKEVSQKCLSENKGNTKGYSDCMDNPITPSPWVIYDQKDCSSLDSEINAIFQ